MGLKEMFQDFESGLIKWGLVGVALLIAVFILGYAIGHC